MVTAVSTDSQAKKSYIDMSIFSSLKLFFVLIACTATTILVGSWCPQEAQVGREKVIEQFGTEWGPKMIQYGIADIFHTPFFLGLIGLLTVNLVCASCTRVFPKVKLLKQPMPMLCGAEISKMAVHRSVQSAARTNLAISALVARLKRQGFFVRVEGNNLTAHFGKVGRLAATVTHIGLLTLLTGVTITSWTGFSGFEPIELHKSLSFAESQHSRMWIGKMPKWSVRVDATRREDHENGDPKQWYSTLSVIDPDGKLLKTQEISVNNPLSYDGVDIYQSSWGLRGISVSFGHHTQILPLQQMGRVHAAVLPLDERTVMLFSLRELNKPIRVFAKIPEWPAPRLLTLLPLGQPTKLGSVKVTYNELIPATGLQYKSDPGLPITYTAFGFIILGVLLASIPYRQIWAAAEERENGSSELIFGGMSKKAKTAFDRGLDKLAKQLQQELNDGTTSADLSGGTTPTDLNGEVRQQTLEAKYANRP